MNTETQKSIVICGRPGGIRNYERNVMISDQVITGRHDHAASLEFAENCILENIEARNVDAQVCPIVVRNVWNSTLRNVSVMQGSGQCGILIETAQEDVTEHDHLSNDIVLDRVRVEAFDGLSLCIRDTKNVSILGGSKFHGQGPRREGEYTGPLIEIHNSTVFFQGVILARGRGDHCIRVTGRSRVYGTAYAISGTPPAIETDDLAFVDLEIKSCY